jgi:outer membrane protein assembly factor BamB
LTGEEAWSEDFGSKVYGQPLPVPGGVIITTANSGVHLMDPVTGKTVWSAPTGEIRQGAAWDGDFLWLATTGGKVIRFDVDGKFQWSGDVVGGWGVWGAPTIVVDGAVVGTVRDATHGQPGLFGFRRSGAPMWDTIDRGTRATWANVRTSAAYADGKLIYAEAYSDYIVVADVAAGRVEHVVAAGACTFPQWASPVVNRDEIIVPRHDGGLYALGREDAQPRWGVVLGDHTQTMILPPDDLNPGVARSCSWQSPQGSLFATPAIGPDGTVYVGSGEGWLYAIAPARTADSGP